jgi:hypothetical protein
MSDVDWVVARNLGLCVLIVAVLCSLAVIWDRERVKRHLVEDGCTVLKVRWKPFAWWGPIQGHSFVVEWVDILGLIHRGKCWTFGFPFGIGWHEEEVVGRSEEFSPSP